MKASDYIAKFFYDKGIEFNYVFTGGAIAHIIDSCWKIHERSNSKLLKPICVLHEQAGSMAMDAYSRFSGKPGLMMVTSGPGATNLLTGIACSYYDSIPGIYITGQVRTWELSKQNQRQLGFQETDIVNMVKGITKYSKQITKINNIPEELEKAYLISTTGRPGPVLLDIPMDIQWSKIQNIRRNRNKIKNTIIKKKINIIKLNEVIKLIKNSSKISILCGGGVRHSKSEKLFKEFAEKLNAPVFTTYSGKECFPNDHSLYAGMTGTMGHKPSNKNINQSDLLFVIGSRLSWRQVRSTPKEFAKKSKIIHVDIDKGEINQKIKTKYGFDIDAKVFLKAILSKINNSKITKSDYWKKKCVDDFLDYRFYKEKDILTMDKVNPYFFFEKLSKLMGNHDVIIPDTGQNVMWTMQEIRIRKHQRLLTSWGHSPMGYSLPASMGIAAIKNIKGNVICIIGDGGMQLNIQELQTIKNYKYKIKIFILNNHSLGAIKDFNRDNLDGRMYGTNTEYGYSHPDFCKVSKSYGFKSEKIKKNKEVIKKIKKVLSSKDTMICDVDLGNETFVKLDPFVK